MKPGIDYRSLSRVSASRLFILAMATFALTMAGCSSDSPTDPALNQQSADSGIIRGGVEPGAIAFEYVSATNGDPENPVDGPFAIRGRNIRYESGALIVDLSVANLGEGTYPEPVSLTFMSLLPDGLTVSNPDNEENGAGASIGFAFENDDAMWSPGEESIARSTNFVAEEGAAIAFIAQIEAGMGEDMMGSIGGMVWDDANGDGMMDAGETALEGAMVALDAEGMDTVMATTDADGTYRFDGLSAGFYAVSKVASETAVLTTGSPIYVTLVELEGVVSSFLAANFGCMAVDGKPYGTITGTAFEDANENGMLDEGEPGIGGLEVRMAGPEDFNGLGVTDADGGYMFSVPMDGDYTVSMQEVEGYSFTTDASVTMTLTSADDVVINFGLVMDGGGNGGMTTVSGHVFEDLDENHRYGDDEPGIEGVEVRIFKWERSKKAEKDMWKKGRCTSTESGADGLYAFESVDPGYYLISCERPKDYHRTTFEWAVVIVDEDGNCGITDFGFISKDHDDCGDDDHDDDEDDDAAPIARAIERVQQSE